MFLPLGLIRPKEYCCPPYVLLCPSLVCFNMDDILVSLEALLKTSNACHFHISKASHHEPEAYPTLLD